MIARDGWPTVPVDVLPDDRYRLTSHVERAGGVNGRLARTYFVCTAAGSGMEMKNYRVIDLIVTRRTW